MTITIKTRLADGIYRSDGGGQTITHYEFATGPRNLLRAIDTLATHQEKMRNGFGNIGCGRSWLEIDGHVIPEFDLRDVATDDVALWGRDERGVVKSRTEKARALIAKVNHV